MPNTPNEIKINDNLAGAEYTNGMQVSHNKEEFQVVFVNLFGESGKTVAKLITTPGHFKRMINAMQDNLKRYEATFGVVAEVAAPEGKKIGFDN